MKKVMVLLVTMFAFLSMSSVASADNAFSLKMKDAGFRWTQDMDDFGNFWDGQQNQNGLRMFGTAFVGSKSHQVRVAYEQDAMSAPWDVFQGRSQLDEQVFIEYQYNFDQ
jgi:hypothetical protein